jgi:hypothetical protein
VSAAVRLPGQPEAALLLRLVQEMDNPPEERSR